MIKLFMLFLGMTVLLSWRNSEKECKLSVLKITTSKGEMAVEYVYKGNQITKVRMRMDGRVWDSTLCTYDAAGRLSKLKGAMDKATYSYDQAGRLIKIESTGMFSSTTLFEYNDKGQITKEKVLGNRDQVYTYDEQGNPVQMKMIIDGKVVETYDYTYDNKINPVKQIDMLTMRSQYPVQFSPHNILSCVHTYTENEMMGDQILTPKGTKSAWTMTYEYNENGYPVKMTGERYVLEYSYDCK